MTTATISAFSRAEVWNHIDENGLPVKKLKSTAEARQALIDYYNQESAKSGTDSEVTDDRAETEDAALVAVETIDAEFADESDEAGAIVVVDADNSEPMLSRFKGAVADCAEFFRFNDITKADSFYLSYFPNMLRFMSFNPNGLIAQAAMELDNFQGAKGAIVLPKAIAALTSKLPKEGDISFGITEHQGLKFNCANTTYECTGSFPEDYPTAPVVPADGISLLLEMPLDKFHAALKSVAFSAQGNVAANPSTILKAVCLEILGNNARLVTIDGHRLTTALCPITEITAIESKDELKGRRILIDESLWKALLRLPKSMLTPGASFKLAVCGEELVQAHFNRHSLVLTARSVPGTYPNWEQLISNAPSNRIALNVAQMRQQLASICPIVAEKPVVTLEFKSEKQVSLTASDTRNGDADVDASYLGTDLTGMKIAFNFTYFQQVFANFSGDDLTVDLRGSLELVAFHHLDQHHYLMPVQIRA